MQARLYGCTAPRSSAGRAKLGANCDRRAPYSACPCKRVDSTPMSPQPNRPPDGSKENAPSRWSLRPTIRLTSAEATVTRRVINLRHSVLGASRTLGSHHRAVKALRSRLVANCEVFFSHRVKLRMTALALVPSEKENGRARRPGRKDSPSRERFRPPSRRTFRFRVVLLGGLRPTGVPCSAQAETYGTGPVRSRGFGAETSRYLRQPRPSGGLTRVSRTAGWGPCTRRIAPISLGIQAH